MISRKIKFLSLISICLIFGCGLRHRPKTLSKKYLDEKPKKSEILEKEDHFEIGRRLFYKNDLNGAVKEFEISIQENPLAPERHYNLGLVFHRLKNYQMAVEKYKKAIQLKPDFSEAYYNLGVVYDQIGQFDNAINAYNNAIKNGLDDATIHFNKAVVFLKQCRFNEAKNENLKALEIKSDFSEVYNNLGYIAESETDINKAIEMYKMSLKLKPDYLLAKENLERLLKGPVYEKAPRAEGGIWNRFSLEFDGTWKFEKDIELLDTKYGDVEVGSENKNGIFRLGFDITNWLDMFVDLGVTNLEFKNPTNFDRALGIQNTYSSNGLSRYDGFEKVLGPTAGLGLNAEIYKIKRLNLGFDAGLELLMGLNEEKETVGAYKYTATSEWMEYMLSLRAKYIGFQSIVPYCGVLFDTLDGNFEIEDSSVPIKSIKTDYAESNPFGIILGSSYYFGRHIRLQTEARALNEYSLALRMKYSF